MSRRSQPLYATRSTRGDLTNAAIFGAWFVVGVLTAIHEVMS